MKGTRNMSRVGCCSKAEAKTRAWSSWPMDGMGRRICLVSSDVAAHCARSEACMANQRAVPLNMMDMKMDPENKQQYQPGGAQPCMPIRPAQERAAPTAKKSVVTLVQVSILVTVTPVMPAMSSRYWATCALALPRAIMKRPKRMPESLPKFSLL